MRQPPRVLWAVLTAVVVLTGACGDDSGDDSGGASLVGTYECRLEGETGPPISTIELRDDGTGTITIGEDEATFEITWAAEGESGSFGPGTAEEDPFTIEGENIVFADPTGNEPSEVCAPVE